MIFSLEAMQAFNGDCLLLHGGTADDPKLVLIDGGPTRTWGRSLKPRFEQLRQERAPGGGPLRIDLAMVSHIDDDHVAGMVAFTTDLISQTGAKNVDVEVLWHNSFDDIIGNLDEELRKAALAGLAAPVSDEIGEAQRAVMASVPNGLTLREHAETLGWSINEPFGQVVSLPEDKARTIKVGDMNLTVVCPRAEQLRRLNAAWEGELKKAAKKKAGAAPTALDPDGSAFNLSSIVVVAECQGKTMLLTGDALDTHILSGLEQAGFLKNGKAHFDIFKLPHHGSARNIGQEFFDAITADHYVISANGHDGNPDLETLRMIPLSRQDDDFEIHLTNDVEDDDSLKGLVEHVRTFRVELEEQDRKFTVSARKDPALSLRIDLLDGA